MPLCRSCSGAPGLVVNPGTVVWQVVRGDVVVSTWATEAEALAAAEPDDQVRRRAITVV